jgi:hypothetical protein
VKLVVKEMLTERSPHVLAYLGMGCSRIFSNFRSAIESDNFTRNWVLWLIWGVRLTVNPRQVISG